MSHPTRHEQSSKAQTGTAARSAHSVAKLRRQQLQYDQKPSAADRRTLVSHSGHRKMLRALMMSSVVQTAAASPLHMYETTVVMASIKSDISVFCDWLPQVLWCIGIRLKFVVMLYLISVRDGVLLATSKSATVINYCFVLFRLQYCIPRIPF